MVLEGKTIRHPIQGQGQTPGVAARATRIRVYIVEEQRLLRESMAIFLGLEKDMQVVGQAASGEEALQVLQGLEVDVALVGVRLPGMAGAEAIRLVKERHPTLGIVALTSGQEDVGDALEAGAIGCVSIQCTPQQVAEALREAYRGQSYIDSAVACTLVEEVVQLRKAYRASLLSPRQRDILRMIANGARHSEIAHRLSISKTTVSREMRRVFDQLGVNDATHAVYEAYRRHII